MQRLRKTVWLYLRLTDLIEFHKFLILIKFHGRFNQANSLHSHREYVHKANSVRHTCPSCGRMYKTLQLLKRHCKINHQDENVNFNQPSSLIAKRRFHCSDCGESFTLKSQLRTHAETEHTPTQEQVVKNLKN